MPDEYRANYLRIQADQITKLLHATDIGDDELRREGVGAEELWEQFEPILQPDTRSPLRQIAVGEGNIHFIFGTSMPDTFYREIQSANGGTATGIISGREIFRLGLHALEKFKSGKLMPSNI